MARMPGGQFHGKMLAEHRCVLTPEALAFLADLHRTFNPRKAAAAAPARRAPEALRQGRAAGFPAGNPCHPRGIWKVAPIPADLLDRRVEITGPTDRKMVINALNSGAKVFMADFEDANSPTWDNLVRGQINLMDRWSGAMDYRDPDSSKSYVLGKRPAVLMVRPRGWHLRRTICGSTASRCPGRSSISACMFSTMPRPALAPGSGPYFYLPKMESHLEARLWNNVFIRAQSALGLPLGTIKATVLIETLPAAFEMDEILYELRDHIVGLNCGRWDYIFSFIKTLRQTGSMSCRTARRS